MVMLFFFFFLIIIQKKSIVLPAVQMGTMMTSPHGCQYRILLIFYVRGVG